MLSSSLRSITIELNNDVTAPLLVRFQTRPGGWEKLGHIFFEQAFTFIK